MTLRGFWKYLICERMGRRRPLPNKDGTIGPEDLRLRREFEERLRQAFKRLDITVDLYSMRPKDHHR